MSEHLKKVEEELLPEIELAAIKGNMNRVITALRASLAALVEHAKLCAPAPDAVAFGGGIPTRPPTPRVDGDEGEGAEGTDAAAFGGGIPTRPPTPRGGGAGKKTTKAPARKPAKKAPAEKTGE